ncbi:hypothetical protein ZHAS_00012278 [Anopheles sinensis]|uniref:Uncharacterized protein n=1 Tax=Anopheles sinensis TaxID=74873 RepID=A0A084W296_ANOSI|nr:hypothetical protein ZHAS_00012278 [Anopheles sinensis]
MEEMIPKWVRLIFTSCSSSDGNSGRNPSATQRPPATRAHHSLASDGSRVVK